MKDFYTLDEAEKLTGIPKASLRKRINQGRIPAVKMPKCDIAPGSTATMLYQVLTAETVTGLMGGEKEEDWEKLEGEWIQSQRNGYLTGKPISARGVEANAYGLTKYWEYLGKKKSVENFTAENLRVTLTTIPIDDEARNCHYSMRDQIFKGFRSMARFLIQKNLRPHSLLADSAPFKPHRIYPPRKTSLKPNQLYKLLNANALWSAGGRSAFTKAQTGAVIGLLAYAGLRRQEATEVMLHHTDMVNRVLFVACGKGRKPRSVGICDELYALLSGWLKYRPKGKDGNLLLNKDGTPLTGNCIRIKIERLSEYCGLDITAHGLRRTFATVMEAKGMPLSYVQLMLGHEDITTTQGYIMADVRDAVEWLKTGGKPPTADPLTEALMDIYDK